MLTKIIKFSIVGGIGFIVDAAILYVMIRVGVGAYAGRFVSIGAAMIVTFILNKNITFNVRIKDSWIASFFSYVSISASAMLVNLALYYSLLFWGKLPPLISLVIASIFSLSVNFFGYSKIVFKERGNS